MTDNKNEASGKGKGPKKSGAKSRVSKAKPKPKPKASKQDSSAHQPKTAGVKSGDVLGKSFRFDIESFLTKDEEVIQVGKIHWGIYWKPFVVLLFALSLLLFVYQFTIILGIAGVLYLAYCVLLRHMLLLVLTNKRVFFRYGILQVDVIDMRFKNVESVELERMLPGFIFGYSNVAITGIGNRGVVIPYVGNGVVFRRAFNEMVLDEETIDEDAVDRAKNAGNVSAEG